MTREGCFFEVGISRSPHHTTWAGKSVLRSTVSVAPQFDAKQASTLHNQSSRSVAGAQ